jgi:hypothetical protein
MSDDTQGGSGLGRGKMEPLRSVEELEQDARPGWTERERRLEDLDAEREQEGRTRIAPGAALIAAPTGEIGAGGAPAGVPIVVEDETDEDERD